MKRALLAVACATASPVLADTKDEAKVHMQAAAVAYKEGRYEDTLAELNKAYAKDPKPELHYSIGQVYVKLNRCADAIVAYENFLASKPSRERADLANQAIATCKAQQAQTTPTTTTPTEPAVQTGTDTEAPPGIETPPAATGTTTTAPATTTTTTVDSPPAWYKDKLGLGLTGGGAILTIVGLVMYSSARGKIDDAENADDYGKSQALYDDAQSQRTTSMVVVTLGLAATGVGVWRLVKKRSEEQERNVAFVPTTDGGLITYSGGF
jgi:tetratricopeptide (TPR) repeat protein